MPVAILAGSEPHRQRDVEAELDESLVERVVDDVIVVIARDQRAEEVGLELHRRAHPAELEVAQPELAVGQVGAEAVLVEVVDGEVRHHS